MGLQIVNLFYTLVIWKFVTKKAPTFLPMLSNSLPKNTLQAIVMGFYCLIFDILC